MSLFDAIRQVPYIKDKDIEERAEKFIQKNWESTFPVDVEEICDRLGISIISLPGLKSNFSIDAYTSSDFKTIWIDENCFKKYENRSRFSIAHELGHITLHQNFYPKDIHCLEDCVRHSAKYSDGRTEFQANLFAGNLLVPKQELLNQLQKVLGDSSASGLENSSNSEKIDALIALTKHFQVSREVIARRISSIYPNKFNYF